MKRNVLFMPNEAHPHHLLLPPPPPPHFLSPTSPSSQCNGGGGVWIGLVELTLLLSIRVEEKGKRN